MEKIDVALFEDSRWKYFEPLSLTRAIHELRPGILSFGERIRLNLRFLGIDSLSLRVRPYLRRVTKERFPDMKVSQGKDSIYINARILVTKAILKEILSLGPGTGFFSPQGDLLAFRLPEKKRINLKETGEWDPEEIGSYLEKEEREWPSLSGIWEIPHMVSDAIREDRDLLGLKGHWGEIDPGVHLIEPHDIVIGAGAKVMAGAVLDASAGPIILGERTEVGHNAVLIGPLFLDKDSKVKMGARLWGGVSGGPCTKLGGEVEASVFHGYSNKQHDGFFGHSYIGEWVNIGAESTTSDLKNTYGEITLEFPLGKVRTGTKFVGSFFGDHSKAGIHTMLNSGTLVGVSSNIFGADFMPKLSPSFVWGGPNRGWDEYRLQDALRVAERVLRRRGKTLSRPLKSLLEELFQRTRELRILFLEEMR